MLEVTIFNEKSLWSTRLVPEARMTIDKIIPGMTKKVNDEISPEMTEN